MSFLDIVRIAAIGISVLVVIAGLGLLFLEPEKLEALFGTDTELPEIDFASLKRAGASNSYLVCPTGRCPSAVPDAEAPVFGVGVEELRARLLQFVDRSPDIRAYRMDLERQQFDFIERTPTMRFPDVITVRLYPVDGEGSSLAVYSRSVFGRSDFGENRRRVRRWLAALTPVEGG